MWDNGENLSEISRAHGVRLETLKNHYAARKRGTTVEIGRPRVLSHEQADNFRKELEQRDISKDSLVHCQAVGHLDQFVSSVNPRKGVSSDGLESGYSSRALRNHLKAMTNTVRAGGVQTQDRKIALDDIYSQIAFSVSIRLAFGFTESTSSLGREPNEQSTLKDFEKMTNIDISGPFL